MGDQKFLIECKSKLLEIKKDLLSRQLQMKTQFADFTKSGDETDLAVAQIEEDAFLLQQNRFRTQLFEIESALARIEKNDYGICEETGEPIEKARLLALPHTRLSIEGAEIREKFQKRFLKFASI